MTQLHPTTTDLEQLLERYATDPSVDIAGHLPYLVQTAVELNAGKIIELGTRTGVSTVAFLVGLAQSGGRLWSVDLDPAPPIDSDRWTFLQGDDLAPDIVTALPDSADVVFIDTSHGYEQTYAELNVYRWKVRPGGRILLHDTDLARPWGMPVEPKYPVKTAIEDFCRDERISWTNRPGSFGLGVIQIPGGPGG